MEKKSTLLRLLAASLLSLFSLARSLLSPMGFWGGTFLFLLFGVGAGVGVTFLSRPSHQG